MQTFSNLMIVVSIGLYLIACWLRLRSVFGRNRSGKLSQKQEEALLKAWEDYEVGLNGSARRSTKGSVCATEPRNIIRFASLFTLGIVVLCLGLGGLFGVRTGRPEHLTIAATICVMLTVVCWAVTLLVAALVVMARSIPDHWHRVSRKPPRIPGEGGGVRDEWLDGPQAAAVNVKLRPRRSAASG